MNTIDGNILCAKYLGFQKTDIGWYDFDEKICDKLSNTFDSTDLRFNCDWIMCVVKEMNNDVMVVDAMDEIYFIMTDCDIEKTFIAITTILQRLEIIKW